MLSIILYVYWESALTKLMHIKTNPFGKFAKMMLGPEMFFSYVFCYVCHLYCTYTEKGKSLKNKLLPLSF